MNNSIKWSEIGDVKSFAPSRPGTSFVCETCCGNGQLKADQETGCIIFHCPDHMTLCIKDGEVLYAKTNGIRQ